MNYSHFRKTLAIIAIAFLSVRTIHAATYTWNGSAGSSIWTNPNQWTPNAPGPVFTDDSSNPGDDLIFGASVQATVNLRVDGGTTATDEDKVKTLTFTAAAPAYTFTSASNTPDGQAHDIDLYGNLTNNSGKTQTFATGISLNGPSTISGTTGNVVTNYSFEAGDHLWFGGAVTYNGPFDVHVSGTSSRALQGANPLDLTLNNAKIIVEGGMTFTGNFNLGGNGEIILNGGGWGNAAIAKKGNGTLVLNAATSNAFRFTIDNGTVRIGNNNALGAGNTATEISGNTFDGKLQLYNNIFVNERISFEGRQNETSTAITIENYSGNNTLNGIINLSGGGGSYNFGSLSGKLTVASDMIYTTTIANPDATRTITMRGPGDIEFTGAIGHNSPGGAVAFTHYGTGKMMLSGVNNYRLGHFIAVGGGTLTIGPTFGNTDIDTVTYPLFDQYDDTATTNPIRFQLLNNSKLDVSNALNLNAPGTLQFGLNRIVAGNGTVIGNVRTIATDSANTANRYRNSDPNGKAAFKPGDIVNFFSSGGAINSSNPFSMGVGRLTVQGNLDLSSSNSSDDLEWHLGTLKDQANGTAGVDWDLLSITGDTKIGTNDTFTIGAFNTIAVNGPNAALPNVFWNSSHSWKVLDTLLNSSGTNNFLFAPGTVTHYNALGSFTGGYFTLSLGSGSDAGDVYLNWVTPIPEPSTIVLVGVSLAFCAYRIRRKA